MMRNATRDPNSRERSQNKGELEPGRIAASLGIALRAGAGEGIRTLDPNLGKVVLYP